MAAPGDNDPWEYSLRKYLLLLATLVATVTYAAGFSPPGGVWQDTDDAAGRLAGDPIIRDTSYRRYLVFFYCNATAFASSLVVIVLILLLAIQHEHDLERGRAAATTMAPLHSLRAVMLLDLLSLMGAYAAGTCRDTLTAVYSSVLVLAVLAYVAVHMVLALRAGKKANSRLQRLRKVLMLLATFAVSVTYLAGLSAPGGFWDSADGGHRPGDAVLKGRHDARLKAFFVSNTTAFAASLLIIVLLLDKKLERSDKLRSRELYGFVFVALVGLVVAYSAGSCREIDTTIYVNALVGAVLLCILVQAVIATCFMDPIKKSWLWKKILGIHTRVSKWLQAPCCGEQIKGATPTENGNASDGQEQTQALEKARSLVLLLATLAATITYQAGLDPPGGLWQDDGDGHRAGDPILITTNPRRYKAFFYCNSVAFVASLVVIVLVQKSVLLRHHALEAAMILDLFGLIGAYAAGSCRDVSTSIYAMALAGAVLVYVVIHVVFFTLDHEVDVHSGGKEKEAAEALVEKRRKRLLLFAILAATITYQAGLTPPSGFRLRGDESGHRAGDPVLLYNYPRRYRAFFYCNTVSFMLSIALIILLVNRNLYRPAIRSNALSVCTAAGMFGLVGAYAAGSTQHLKTSIYIFALAAVVMSFVVVLVIVFFFVSHTDHKVQNSSAQQPSSSSRSANADVEMVTTADATAEEPSAGKRPGSTGAVKKNKSHAKRKYLMLLGILVASVTYQAGLEPPGGVWQGDGGGHAAGDPVLHDNRRPRYLAFFYSNSISFVASVVVIVLLLSEYLQKDKQRDRRESPLQEEEEDKPESEQERGNWWLGVMNSTIVLDLLGLLVAYATGSSRSWKTTGYVFALVVAVLAYVAIHVALSCLCRGGNQRRRRPSASQAKPEGKAGDQAQNGSV